MPTEDEAIERAYQALLAEVNMVVRLRSPGPGPASNPRDIFARGYRAALAAGEKRGQELRATNPVYQPKCPHAYDPDGFCLHCYQPRGHKGAPR